MVGEKTVRLLVRVSEVNTEVFEGEDLSAVHNMDDPRYPVLQIKDGESLLGTFVRWEYVRALVRE